MSNPSQNQDPQCFPAVLSRKTLAIVFSLGTVFGTGIGVGYQKVVTASQTVAVVSADEYDKIHQGMTLTDVRSILGPGTEVSWSETGIEMEWPVSSGDEAITAIFEEQKLVAKQRLRNGAK